MIDARLQRSRQAGRAGPASTTRTRRPPPPPRARTSPAAGPPAVASPPRRAGPRRPGRLRPAGPRYAPAAPLVTARGHGLFTTDGHGLVATSEINDTFPGDHNGVTVWSGLATVQALIMVTARGYDLGARPTAGGAVCCGGLSQLSSPLLWTRIVAGPKHKAILIERFPSRPRPRAILLFDRTKPASPSFSSRIPSGAC
jgi:hypothetical protein